jgi:hypothetical protein
LVVVLISVVGKENMKPEEKEKAEMPCACECGAKFGFASHDDGKFGAPFCPKCGSYDTYMVADVGTGWEGYPWK